jgi:hypothetical protein
MAHMGKAGLRFGIARISQYEGRHELFEKRLVAGRYILSALRVWAIVSSDRTRDGES